MDIDLSKPLKDHIRVDTDNLKFWISLEYDCVPVICSVCQSLGHLVASLSVMRLRLRRMILLRLQRKNQLGDVL